MIRRGLTNWALGACRKTGALTPGPRSGKGLEGKPLHLHLQTPRGDRLMENIEDSERAEHACAQYQPQPQGSQFDSSPARASVLGCPGPPHAATTGSTATSLSQRISLNGYGVAVFF